MAPPSKTSNLINLSANDFLYVNSFFTILFQTTPPGGVGKLPNCESADIHIEWHNDNEMECNVKPIKNRRSD